MNCSCHRGQSWEGVARSEGRSGPVSICRVSTPLNSAALGTPRGGCLRPLSSELASQNLGHLYLGRSLSRLPRVWGPRGGARGSPLQALVPLEDPRAEAEGPWVWVWVHVCWKGCQAASPRSAFLPSGQAQQQGCPSCLACPNPGLCEPVLRPRAAKGRGRQRLERALLGPLP